MSWLYSQVLVEEYLGDISLDGEQSVQSSGSSTPQAYCAPDKMTGFSRLSRFGMTFKPLTENLGEELLTLYLAAFHAPTLVQQEKEQESMEKPLECGEKWRGSFTKYDPDTSSWKTHQCSLLGDLDEFLETWPQWGLMRDGECWEQRTLEHHIRGTGIWIVAKWRGQLPHAQHDRIRWWEQQQESLETTHRQMANTDIIGLDESKTKRDRTQEQQVCQNEFDYGSEVWSETIGCGQFGDEKEVANSASVGLQGQGEFEQPINSKTYEDWKAGQSANVRESDFWAIEPNVCRVVNGMASRVDRIKALGNGQVPLCAATAWRILK